MLSHAHAFRHGFALPKVFARAARALRAFGKARHRTLAADFGPHIRADLGLSPDGPVTLGRRKAH
jgi:hypothetical protein